MKNISQLKNISQFFRPLPILLLTLALPAALQAADPAGAWKSEFETQVGAFKYTYNLTNDGGKITGQAVRQLNDEATTNQIAEGTVTNDDVTFVETAHIQENDVRIEYSGKLDGDKMDMTRKVGDFGSTNIVLTRDTATATTAAPALAGQWLSEFDSGVGHQKYTYDLKLTGDVISGTARRQVDDNEATTNEIKGKLSGAEITFTEPLKVEGQDDLTIEYTGKLDGDDLKLTRKVGDFATTDITAHRAK